MKENKFLAYFSLVISFLALSVPLLLFGFAVWSERDSQPGQHNGYTADSLSGLTEDKERNRKEGILYTIDDTEKVTMTSYNGEICVKIPRWNGFSAELADKYSYSRNPKLNMTDTEDYVRMTYELIATWHPEEVEADIVADMAADLERYDDYMLGGDIYRMAVKGIDVCYLSCYDTIYSPCIRWYYTVWADLGCGQVLKIEITQRNISDEAKQRARDRGTILPEVTEPLNIEGMLETLYSNIEVCTPEGDVIPVTYREPLPENDEKTFYNFSYGTVREYKDDEYRETTVCAELIDSLYEAVQTGGIEELLEREAIEKSELSIAEKIDYIKKEETGKLTRYDSLYADGRDDSFIYIPSKYYLVEEAHASKEFLIYSVYDHWYKRFYYIWFPCEKDDAGNTKAQKGMYIYGTDTREHYFLSCQGKPYLCLVNRDSRDEIKSVILYDFVTPDYIGTVIYIDASSVYLCSYVRNEDSFGTEMPWYLYSNKIDRGKVYFAMPEQWKITEYLGESDAFQIEDTGSAVYEREQERTQNLVDNYLGQEINTNWNWESHYVSYFQSASEYGYYYTSLENLYKVYRQPGTLAMEAPLSCATMRVTGFDEDIDIIVDKNGKAAICVEGRFFRLEKSDEEIEELRTWE